jgi:hypothetical protein
VNLSSKLEKNMSESETPAAETTSKPTALDLAIAKAQARKEAKAKGEPAPKTEKPAKAEKPAKVVDEAKVIKAAREAAEKKAEREQRAQEREAAKLERDAARTAKATERAAKAAETAAARAAAKAEKDAAKAAAKAAKPAHTSKVEKARAKLPALSDDAQSAFQVATENLSLDQIEALSLHLAFQARLVATQQSNGRKLEVGSPVRILNGKYAGKVGTISKTQHIRCFVAVEGVAKEIYLFKSQVEPVTVEALSA